MTPKQQLDAFLDRFSPDIARTARSALAKLRKLTSGATELVYDNYRGLVVGFGPTERPSDAVLSIAIYSGRIALCFIQNGPRIPDPKKLLRGSGTVARHIRLQSAATLDEPPILALIAAAKSMARVPFDPNQRRRLIIRSVAVRQLPRRPAPSQR
jgi:hypothetical protein